MDLKAGIAALILFSLMVLNPAGATQAGKRLWVLNQAGEIAEIDPSTWAVRSSIKLPSEILRDTQCFAVNRHGQMLFCPNREAGPIGPLQNTPFEKTWLWNGRKAFSIDRAAIPEPSIKTGINGEAIVDRRPRCSLSADGRDIYWFENEFRLHKNQDGVDISSVSTTWRVYRSGLEGEKPAQIASFAFPVCNCGTGECSETCPEASFWFPEEGVGDFFLVTRWIPGQIGATYEASSLFRSRDQGWSEHRLPKALEEVEDAARGGGSIIYRVLDGACCGWDNAGDDQTILYSDGRETVLFDELKRYRNPNYDVSFFTSNARFSPDLRTIAMTILSTAMPGNEIRLTDEGKPNPEELARIHKSIMDLPVIEVVRTDDPSKPIAVFRHATLVGWMNHNEILMVENGVLAAVDVFNGHRRISPVKVADKSIVFLR
jgi:hypothetical protein